MTDYVCSNCKSEFKLRGRVAVPVLGLCVGILIFIGGMYSLLSPMDKGSFVIVGIGIFIIVSAMKRLKENKPCPKCSGKRIYRLNSVRGKQLVDSKKSSDAI